MFDKIFKILMKYACMYAFRICAKSHASYNFYNYYRRDKYVCIYIKVININNILPPLWYPNPMPNLTNDNQLIYDTS